MESVCDRCWPLALLSSANSSEGPSASATGPFPAAEQFLISAESRLRIGPLRMQELHIPRQHAQRRFPYLAALAITAAIGASIALYIIIQMGVPSMILSILQGKFYSPIPNPPKTLGERIRYSLELNRVALLPLLAFVVMQLAAMVAFFAALHFEGRFTRTRRVLAGIGLSLVMTAVSLSVVWSVLAAAAPR